MSAVRLPCLSVRQPWAWLLVHGHKDLENRDWSTKVRGLVGIHAGLRFDEAGYAWVRRTFPTLALPAPSAFERGGLVGVVEITACVTASDSPWFQGRYGFVVRHGRALPFRRCRGKLGFLYPDVAEPGVAAVPAEDERRTHDATSVDP